MTRVSGDQFEYGNGFLTDAKIWGTSVPFFSDKSILMSYIHIHIYIYTHILLIAFCDPMLGGAVGIIRKNSYGVAPFFPLQQWVYIHQSTGVMWM